MNDYDLFLENKKHIIGNYGIDVNFMPDKLFDFQKYVSEYVIKKGRCAGFLDTGTGKTIIELVTAVNYSKYTNKPVLILTPLAVAFQFLKEAKKFDIGDIEYSKDGKYKSKIVITNYERLHYFDCSEFECVICDESSCIKNCEGATRAAITIFLRKVKYRFLFTATPSPNDFTELGTSSEALGYLGYTDMLTKFFTNNEDTISPQNIGTEWILKGHAKENFFKWVSGWSISMRKPSDLGFDNNGFILPELITNHIYIKNKNNISMDGQMLLFNKIAKGTKEVRHENSITVAQRCEKAVELASAHDISVYWCNLNREGDLIKSLDKNSYQITGRMDLDEKEDLLINFSEGNIKKLITKGKITAWGLNWQHCNHTVYFPDWSYEKYYQAIRRFWRFGQLRKVYADLVVSDGQKRVMDSLIAKADKANQLFSKLNSNLHTSFDTSYKEFDKQVNLPTWI